MSRTGSARAASVNRKASVPYFSMNSRGSMTFPFTLDIFWPSASRTRVWMYTSRKGTSLMTCRPNMAMRATQKNRMS